MEPCIILAAFYKRRKAGELHVRIPLVRLVETLEKVAAAVEKLAERMLR